MNTSIFENPYGLEFRHQYMYFCEMGIGGNDEIVDVTDLIVFLHQD
jgi:hypothetical protein